jgi:uncharacterized protein with HEPN domain
VRSDHQRLADILEAIERIERHTSAGRDEFDASELVQTWVLHHIQIIGEAVRALSPSFRRQHAHVPWPQIIRMRNVLVHAYFGIDRERVWSVVARDLPVLKEQIEELRGTES